MEIQFHFSPFLSELELPNISNFPAAGKGTFVIEMRRSYATLNWQHFQDCQPCQTFNIYVKDFQEVTRALVEG